MSTDFTLNGAPASIDGNHEHLLGALRDELGVFSPKDGCSPTGQCGCCTVLVDGKARVACQTSLDKTEGATVVTLEASSPIRGNVWPMPSLHLVRCNVVFARLGFSCVPSRCSTRPRQVVPA